MANKKEVTIEMVNEAYVIMAKIIRDYGDKYLPVFKRLHEERSTLQANIDLLNIALQITEKKLL